MWTSKPAQKLGGPASSHAVDRDDPTLPLGCENAALRFDYIRQDTSISDFDRLFALGMIRLLRIPLIREGHIAAPWLG